MKKILFILTILMIGSHLYAQQEGEFKFRDALNGYKLMPDQLTIFDKYSSQLVSEFTQEDFSTSSNFRINLPVGQYEIVISKKGYKTIETRFSVEQNSIQDRFYEFSPLERHQKYSLNYLNSMKKSNATVIVGTVVDDNGLALEGVEVFVSEQEKAISNSDGFFNLKINYFKNHDNGIFKDIYYRKNGYKTLKSKDFYIYPNGVHSQNQILKNGSGEVLQKTNDYYIENGTFGGRPEHQIEDNSDIYKKAAIPQSVQALQNCIPSSITVGLFNNTNFGCDCDCPTSSSNCGSCTVFVTLDLEEYVKRCISGEWLSGWSSLPNIHESYAAASVAIRTFGAFRVTQPSGTSYDVKNATCDQKYAGPNPPVWAIAAGTATEGNVLKVNGVFQKAEYSSENNNLSGYSCARDDNVTAAGCGNGNVRNTVTTTTCIADPLGAGWVQFGHGRSMCQFCSARWASGIDIGFWCNNPAGKDFNSGPPHNLPTKTWQQLIAHYYPYHVLESCSCLMDLSIANVNISSDLYLADNSITSSNATVAAGSNVTFRSPAIFLEDGFEAVPGSVFVGEFGNCSTTNFTGSTSEFSIDLNHFENTLLISDTSESEGEFSFVIQNIEGKVLFAKSNISETTFSISLSRLKTNGVHQIIANKNGKLFIEEVLITTN